MRQSGCDVPEWMTTLPRVTKQTKQDLKKRPVKREAIVKKSAFDLKQEARKVNIIKGSKERHARHLHQTEDSS